MMYLLTPEEYQELQDRIARLEKQLKAMQQKQASETARALVARAQEINGVRAIIENLGMADGDYLQAIADALKGQFKGVIVLGGVANNAVSLIAAVSASAGFALLVEAAAEDGAADATGSEGAGGADEHPAAMTRARGMSAIVIFMMTAPQSTRLGL